MIKGIGILMLRHAPRVSILCAVFLESGVDMRQVARGARLTVAALNRVRRMATAYQDGCRSAEEN